MQTNGLNQALIYNELRPGQWLEQPPQTEAQRRIIEELKVYNDRREEAH